jgi:hypothetical protein
MGRRGIYVGFWQESQKERHHKEDPGTGGDNIKMNFREI